jgi:MFS family permease
MSPFNSGLVFLALSAGAGGASFYSGRLAEKYPADRMMAIGMLISTAGVVGLTTATSLWLYTPLFFVTGVGLGLAWALTQVATQAVVPAEYAGASSGITLTSFVMLAAVGVAIAAAVCELVAGSAEAAPSDARAIDVILLAGAALAFVGAVGLMMFGRPRTTARDAR